MDWRRASSSWLEDDGGGGRGVRVVEGGDEGGGEEEGGGGEGPGGVQAAAGRECAHDKARFACLIMGHPGGVGQGCAEVCKRCLEGGELFAAAGAGFEVRVGGGGVGEESVELLVG